VLGEKGQDWEGFWEGSSLGNRGWGSAPLGGRVGFALDVE